MTKHTDECIKAAVNWNEATVNWNEATVNWNEARAKCPSEEHK